MGGAIRIRHAVIGEPNRCPSGISASTEWKWARCKPEVLAHIALAARAGMSREGFSRMFARRHGMPPHAFWLMARLNQARGLLRAGEAIAAVAAETGFADQSHLGRWFRRAFGVTPGRYRSGWP